MLLENTLETMIEQIKSAKILCIGDLMLDQFIYGEVERISPEAPVPILKIKRKEYMLGGAGNVVRNIASLGAKALFMGIIGHDDYGNIIKKLLAEQTDEQSLLFPFAHKTTVKKRFVTNFQQLLRVDDELALTLTAEQKETLLADFEKLVQQADLVIISDYGKGLFTKDVLAKVIAIANQHHKKVVVDPKGKDFSIYAGAFIVTPNKKELAEATNCPVNNDDHIINAAQTIIKQCQINNVLVTRSDEGMTLVENNGQVKHFKALAKEVFDVSGAGDTVVAVIAACLGAEIDLVNAIQIANIAGSVVVSKKGTAVAYPEEIYKALHENQSTPYYTDKIVRLPQALELINLWRAKGLKIGFTNGCFDLLHPGHISLIEQAKQTCNKLVIGLNSDASVQRLKGESRPIQNETARALILSSLSAVNLVVIFEEDTPLNLITNLKPDVLVKGADYTIATVVGADVVISYGGKVVLAELKEGFSTSNTIKKMTLDH